MKYKAYFLSHGWLSPQQAGIQAAHCLGEMMINHQDSDIFQRWLKEDKTIILLNGKTSSNLGALHYWLDYKFENDNITHAYPYAKFHEDQKSMDNLMTCVGVILPEHVF